MHDVLLDHDDPDRLIWPAERRSPPLGCLGFLLLLGVATLAILTSVA